MPQFVTPLGYDEQAIVLRFASYKLVQIRHLTFRVISSIASSTRSELLDAPLDAPPKTQVAM